MQRFRNALRFPRGVAEVLHGRQHAKASKMLIFHRSVAVLRSLRGVGVPVAIVDAGVAVTSTDPNIVDNI